MSDLESARQALEAYRQRMEALGPDAMVPAVLMLAVMGLAHRWAREEGTFTRSEAAEQLIRAIILAQRAAGL